MLNARAGQREDADHTAEQARDTLAAALPRHVSGGLNDVAQVVAVAGREPHPERLLDLAQQQPAPERWSPEDVIERAA